jgi:hypothetical protein
MPDKAAKPKRTFRGYKNEVHVCDLGYHEGVPMLTPLATTPDCEPHTPHPAAYIAHSDWADLMMKTHTQRQCRGCKRWYVWEPKGNPDD